MKLGGEKNRKGKTDQGHGNTNHGGAGQSGRGFFFVGAGAPKKGAEIGGWRDRCGTQGSGANAKTETREPGQRT